MVNPVCPRDHSETTVTHLNLKGRFPQEWFPQEWRFETYIKLRLCRI